MCGRYVLCITSDELAEAFDIHSPPRLAPRYNIAPTQDAPVIRRLGAGAPRTAEMLHWGLVPFWADDPNIGARMINARAESVADKPAFRAAFRRRRCLVPANGFYEWVETGEGTRPVFIRRRDRKPIAFAGLWERWKESDDAEPLESYVIITGAPNDLIKRLHDRMPVILPRAAHNDWLDPDNDDADALSALLRPSDAGALEAYPVTRRVNSPRNDDAALIEPVDDEFVEKTIEGEDPGDPEAPLFQDLD